MKILYQYLSIMNYKNKYRQLICNNLIVIFFLFLHIIQNNENDINKFHKLMKLTSSGEYFTILDSGLYLYDQNFTACKTLYIFQDSEKISSRKDSINTLISEIENNGQYYAIVLAKKYLYIYNCTNNRIFRYLLKRLKEEKSDQDGVNYNLIPYEINNNFIKFIISHMYDNMVGHKIYFYYFTIDFLAETIISEEKYYKDVIMLGFSDLSAFNISCHISSYSPNKLRCFYCQSRKRKFCTINFDLNEWPNMDSKIIIDEFNDKEYIIKIVSSMSDDKNIVFTCVLGKDYKSHCYINNNKNSLFNKVSFASISDCKSIEVYYFLKTDEFAFVCKNDNRLILIKFTYSNYLKNIYESIEFIINDCNYLNNFALIYNDTINDYNFITDCNFSDISICSLNSTESKLEEAEFKEEILTSNITDVELNISIDQEYIDQYENITKEEFINLINIKSNEHSEIEIGSIKIKLSDTKELDFSECEQVLRKHYSLPDSTNINFRSVNLDNSMNQYSAFAGIKELDMSLCKEISIKQKVKITNETNLDLEAINKYKELGIDVLDVDDPFFNEICYSYSEKGNDIILEDRRQDIHQSFTECNQGCKYNDINTEDMTVICDCQMTENFTLDLNSSNEEEFEEISLLDSNIGVIKCYNLVFSFKDKENNMGFWIFSILLLGNIAVIIIYFLKGFKPILEYVYNEMAFYGYLKKGHRMFFEEDKKVSNPNKKRKRKKKAITHIINKNIDLSKENSSSQFKRKLGHNEINLLNELDKNHKSDKKFERNKNKKLSYLTTDDIKHEKSENKNKNDNSVNYGIIKINLNNIKEHIPKDSNQTLHNYNFEEAIKYDKRSIMKIFYIYLTSKQIIFHTFFQKNPLESFSLRICLFIFMLSTDLALNALLYLNDNISKKYKYAAGLFLFTFSNNLTVIIYSTLLSFALMSLIIKLSNSTNALRKIFEEEETKMKSDKKYKISENSKNIIFLKVEKTLKIFRIKILILIIIELILMLFYWYFVTAFCHVYSKTQTSWIFDSFLSIFSRFITEVLFAFLYAKIYLVAVESNIYCIYRAILFIYDFS